MGSWNDLFGKREKQPPAPAPLEVILTPARPELAPKDQWRQTVAVAGTEAYETLVSLAELGQQWEVAHGIAEDYKQFTPAAMKNVRNSANGWVNMLDRAQTVAALHQEAELLYTGTAEPTKPGLYDHGTSEIIDNRLHLQVESVHTLVTGCLDDMKERAGDKWRAGNDLERRIEQLKRQADTQLDALRGFYGKRQEHRAGGAITI